ncbi:hypothetical protein [Rhabdothermincola sediminis]|uniref:hypothetical protein n=1 Tax=Rhabdothermincola sediminis TaxID=2751370 RepID=UPI001AA09D70|nr:hypothetical protein [Rhabdothermincola sediminis]
MEGLVPFIVVVVLALAVGIAVLAAMTGELSARRAGFVARFYALALPFAGLAAASAFTAGATLYYLLFWVEVAMTVDEVLLLADPHAVAAIVSHGPTDLTGVLHRLCTKQREGSGASGFAVLRPGPAAGTDRQPPPSRRSAASAAPRSPGPPARSSAR